ncbi:MAG: hypothetical protein ACI4AM_10185 [Muribaculaceae bacterium]
MKFDPHSQNSEATMRFDPHGSQATPAAAASEATDFGYASSGSGVGTQKFEPGHSSGGFPNVSAEPQAAPKGGTTSKGNPGIDVSSGARRHSSGGRRHSTSRTIVRKITKGPVLVTIIGMLVIAIVAFFTLFDDVWYNIR